MQEIILILLGVFVTKLENRTTPYTIFAFIMLFNSLYWLFDDLNFDDPSPLYEIIIGYYTSTTTIALSILVIVFYKLGYKLLYKYSCIAFCVFCLVMGGYWLIYDFVFYPTYQSSDAKIALMFITSLIRTFGAAVLLLHYKKDDFR